MAIAKHNDDSRDVRSRWRFSLRTLLIVTSLLAVGFGLLGWHWAQQRLQPNHTLLLLPRTDRSMEPYLSSGVYFVVDENAYRASRPERWDVVAFDKKADNSASVLRVVGLPGETISFCNGTVLIEGRPLSRPSPAAKQLLDYQVPDQIQVEYPYTVPRGGYFVLGDNAAEAYDSRWWGALDASRIHGRLAR